MPAIGIYSSVTLAINTPVRLTPPGPGPGNYLVYLLNTAGGNLYISDQNTAGNNATSFKLPNSLYSPALKASSPIWIASDTAGNVSVYCTPAR